MKINIQKIKQVIVEDADGKIIANIVPGMISVETMKDKSQILKIKQMTQKKESNEGN